MCAIFGLLASDLAAGAEQELSQRFAAMGAVLQCRGPDGSWTYGKAGSYLGMHRLALRNGDDASAPLRLASRWCSYNGEVYSVLTPRGEPVILDKGGLEEVQSIVEATGERVPDGMFALAVWDEERRELNLCRDPIGIKPLFTSAQDSCLLFASELKGIIAGSSHVSLDPDAVRDLFCFGWPLPGRTILRGVNEVPPAGTIQASPGERSITLRSGVLPARPADAPGLAPEGFRSALRASVRQCLLGKEPIGLAVSGGIDSTILAHELNALGVENLSTFSVIMPDHSDGLVDLRELGLPAGGAWETWKHHPIEFHAEEFSEYLGRAMKVLCCPTNMTSIVLYQKLAERVAQAGLRVLVVGEGVDELFFGYESYLRFSASDQDVVQYYLGEQSEVLSTLLGRERVDERVEVMRRRYADAGERMGQLRASQLELRLSRLLYRVDSLLMGAGVEGRTPYLHMGIPEMALALRPGKLTGSETKQWLRDQYRGLLPQAGNRKRRFKLDDGLLRRVLLTPESQDTMLRSDPEIDAVLPVEGRRELLSGYAEGRHGRSDLVFLTLTTLLFWEQCGRTTFQKTDGYH